MEDIFFSFVCKERHVLDGNQTFTLLHWWSSLPPYLTYLVNPLRSPSQASCTFSPTYVFWSIFSISLLPRCPQFFWKPFCPTISISVLCQIILPGMVLDLTVLMNLLKCWLTHLTKAMDSLPRRVDFYVHIALSVIMIKFL